MARRRSPTAGTASAPRAGTNAGDRTLYTHNLWLNYLKPVSLGLVFSTNALRTAQVELPLQAPEDQQDLLALTVAKPAAGDDADEAWESTRVLADTRAFLTGFLGWRADLLESYRPGESARMFAGQMRAEGDDRPEPPEPLRHNLPQYRDTLEPAFAYRWPQPPEQGSPYCLLGLDVPVEVDLDRKPPDPDDESWAESPQKKFERLLYETGIPLGLIVHVSGVRIVYRPETQQSGYITFPLAALLKPAGRLACSTLRAMLNHRRIHVLPGRQRLHHILAESRKYQSEVSTRLAEQVLAALFELLKGFQSADEDAHGAILQGLRDRPDRTHEIYEGLLTVLMRLVFLLYAEERETFPNDDLFLRNYSIAGLFARLVEDEGRHPDTMDQRYGAWAHLISLFRVVYGGVKYVGPGTGKLVSIPARRGDLFDPRRFPFLEGRAAAEDAGDPSGPASLPGVPDGTIHRVLRNLLYLNEERLSYRSLEVEQIGSVYEAIMGYQVETATGRSVAIKPEKRHGAPVTIDLDALLATPANKRAERFKKLTDRKMPAAASAGVKSAKTEADLVAALDRLIDRRLTPAAVPAGSLVFQPSPERRRTGSHYTPRSLTGPIVRKALDPVLRRLGLGPTPAAILALKVCDPAMGSGAFLVEAMRQLAKLLVEAWTTHKCLPRIPADETPLLFASRLIAQRCLYGVDRNKMAVDLAKLSLWLATLAKDHAFSFLDHNFRHGDSLVGLALAQIQACHWASDLGATIRLPTLERRIAVAMERRGEILAADDWTSYEKLSGLRVAADEPLDFVRLLGDAILGVFFEGGTATARERRRKDLALTISDYVSPAVDMPTQLVLRRDIEASVAVVRGGAMPLVPFHWEIEFPEVFLETLADGTVRRRLAGGFNAMVGNPPFAGKNTMAEGNARGYPDWLKAVHPESHGNADLVAHFFRGAFNLIRPGGAFGLIATNTIGQGDTRSTGLRWICTHGGTIYEARKRLKWPGEAAVVVSVVHVVKDDPAGTSSQVVEPLTLNQRVAGSFLLDGRPVPIITAYLFHAGGHDDPHRLHANEGKSFQGSIVLGMGFTFDDTDKKGVASPVTRARADELGKSGEQPISMEELIEKDSRNAERIFPYIGGDEVCNSRDQSHHRFAIDFGVVDEEEARRWPDLMKIIEEKVKPGRLVQKRPIRARYWWRYGEVASGLYSSIEVLDRVLAINCGATPYASFAFLSPNCVFANTLDVFALQDYQGFSVLQSRPHELWARFFGSSMKDDLRYTPSDCFETFPFPPGWEANADLETIGRTYYEYRAQLMIDSNLGLTKTYNRFHDPKERSPEIRRLRDLHAEMDRAVLAAYGWPKVDATCGFDLDWCEAEAADDASPETLERLDAGRYFFESAEEARAFADELQGGGAKLPWRHRWKPESRDDILARLLLLNAERAEAERRAGLAPLAVAEPIDEDEDLDPDAEEGEDEE